MKKNLFLMLTVLSLSAFADPKKDKNQEVNFDEKKTKILEGLEKRIEQLQQTKSCISSAKNADELKACREKSKQERKAMKAKWQENRNKRKSEKSN